MSNKTEEVKNTNLTSGHSGNADQRRIDLILRQLVALQNCHTEKDYFSHTHELMLLIADHLHHSQFLTNKSKDQNQQETIPYAQQSLECAIESMWDQWHEIMAKKPRDH